MLPVLIAGLAAGAALGATYAYSRPVRRSVDRAAKSVKQLYHRAPRPGESLHLPATPEDYDVLDVTICDCSRFVADQMDPAADYEAYVLAVRDCVLDTLYPGFGFPLVPGDHPTVQTFWTIITHEVGRNAVEGTLCLNEELVEEGEMEDNPGVVFIRPPRRFPV